MADSDNEESLLLAFKEAGVEFVEGATKAVGELGDKMESIAESQQAAIDVLKEEGTVVADLEEKIRKLKTELESLADAHKAGLISQDAYFERSGKLIQVIKENETVLTRLTAAEREQAEAEAKLLAESAAAEASLAKKAAAAEKAATAARELAAAEAQAAEQIAEANRAMEIASDIADELEKPLARLAGPPGDVESVDGGLKGVAGAAIKAEKAVKELASGHGLMRIGSQLEGIIPLLGGPTGVGMAIGALVIGVYEVIPALKKWFDTWQEGGQTMVDAKKALEEFDTAQKTVHKDMQHKALRDVDKQIEALEAEDRASKAMGLPEYNKEGAEYGLLGRLRARSKTGHAQEKWDKTTAGIGLTKKQREMSQAVKEAVEEAGGIAGVLGEDPNDAAKFILQSAIEGDRDSIETLKRWSPEFANIWQAIDPDAIRQRKRKEAGENTIADVEAKTARNVEKREKAEAREKSTAFKDQIGELKTQLGDLGLDLKEQKLTPEEYQAKADVLVDAIAKAVQDLAKVPGEDLKTARRDIDQAQHTVRSTFDQGVKAVKRAADKAASDARHAADKLQQDKEHWDRTHTPEMLNRAQAREDANAIMDEEQNQNQYRADMGLMPFDAAELEHIKGIAMKHVPEARWRGWNLAELVNRAMAQYGLEIQEGLTQGLEHHHRTQQNTNPYGGH